MLRLVSLLKEGLPVFFRGASALKGSQGVGPFMT